MFKNKKGFTLIELLVVVAIIGILASVILYSVNKVRQSARNARRLSDIRTIQKQLEIYYFEHGEYPLARLNGGSFIYSSTPGSFGQIWVTGWGLIFL